MLHEQEIQLVMSSPFEQIEVGIRQSFAAETQDIVETETLVRIDLSACTHLASIIKDQSIPIDREDTPPPNFSRKELGNFYLCLVALCHQTTPRGKPPLEGLLSGSHKKGWDYLSGRLELAFRRNPDLFKPARWTEIKGHDLTNIFNDSRFGNRLTEPDKRAILLRDLGAVMVKHRWNWAEDLYSLSDGRVATGHPNLIEMLAAFTAYRDPVRKKSYFFLSLMRNSGSWCYADSHLLGPPVDYHETRGHLRLGTVVVANDSLRHKLLNSLPVTEEEDIALRRAVHDAIMLISDLTGLRNPSQLHYLFWNVFRSCCSREAPHCNGCPPDCPLPERYVHLAIHPNGPRRCVFSEICASTCTSTHKRYYEHVFDTDYY